MLYSGYLEGFYFGPYHLIIVIFLHFEDKVHRKQLQRANTIPLLFPRLLCHILEHMGYPTKPHLKRRHHCREHFTLDKWTQLAGYSASIAAPPKPTSLVPPQAKQPQQDELPTEFVPHAPATPPVPEATSTDPSTTPHVPLAASLTSEASITISATEYRAMVHLFQTLTTTHNALFWQMADRAQQDQHTAILRQIQQHLGLLPPPQTNIPGLSEPIAPAEETTKVDVPLQATHKAAIEPSSPLESVAT